LIQHSNYEFGIGSGSYGTVYVREYFGDLVAYKKLNLSNTVSIKEFLKEALLLERLKQGNIIRFLGVVSELKYFGYVMEYCEEGSLSNLIHRKKTVLSSDKIEKLSNGIVNGMKYLHSRNIVHRDLKSENILIKNNHSPIICDFGFAKTLEKSTMSTYRVGSILWQAPEIMRRERYDSKCDVYSFGIILWEMINNQIPYSNIPNIYQKVGVEGFRPPIQINPKSNASEKIKNLIQICWDQIPSKRPNFSELP